MKNEIQIPISIENLSFKYKEYEEKALSSINFDVHKGKFILLCGPTGSGKTTLIRSINGLIPHFYQGHFYGYVRINGKDTIETGSPSEISKNVGTVFQNPENQLFALSVERDIAFALENLGYPREEIRKNVNRAISQIGIEDLRDKPPFELSGGEQQRVALASIIALNPDILVLDEPLSNLDPKTAEKIVHLLKDLQKKENKTIIISEHRIEYVLSYLDEVIIIEDSKVVFHNSISNTLNSDKFFNIGLDIPDMIQWIHENIKLGVIDKPIPVEFQHQLDLSKEIISKCVDIDNQDNQTPPLKEQKLSNSIDEQTSISFQNVCFSYSNKKKNLLERIDYIIYKQDFDIKKGKIIGIVGKNGTGKSTLIKLILGINKPQFGNILIEDLSVNDLPVYEIANKVGLMFQNPDHQLFLNTVREELEFSLKNLNLSKEEKEKRIKSTLKMLNIEELEHKSPFEVSGGQKKKISLATILCRNTEIIIFDEPTIGQDKIQKNSLQSIIRKLQEDGKTILIVSHDMNFIANLADEIFVLNNKGIFCVGKPQEIFINTSVLNNSNLKPLDEISLLNSFDSEIIPKDICTIQKFKNFLGDKNVD